MTAIVSIETVLLVLLIVLVAGLLRSHAELLRRIGPPADVDRGPSQPVADDARTPLQPVADDARTPLQPVADDARTPLEPGADRAPHRPAGVPAPALAGTTLDGDAIRLDFAGAASTPTLLAFLTSGCSTCATFWQTLAERELPQGVQAVIVTRGADRERPVKLRALAPEQVPVVMSSQAWDEYGVPGAPYFVLVDGSIRGEGVASTWQALASLLSDAIEEDRASSGPVRARRVDAALAAGGIGPDHPSLYPGRNGTAG